MLAHAAIARLTSVGLLRELTALVGDAPNIGDEVRNETSEAATNHVQRVVARSETIRYVQLGNPETIKISSKEIQRAVVEEYDIANGRTATRDRLHNPASQKRS